MTYNDPSQTGKARFTKRKVGQLLEAGLSHFLANSIAEIVIPQRRRPRLASPIGNR